MGAEGGVRRRGVTAVGAIVIVAVFLVALANLAAVFMEYSRFSDEVKRANQLVVAKETESLRVTQIAEDRILVENLGSTPSILTGYFKLNPADNTLQYVKFPEPIIVPQLSSKEVSVSTPNINWKVGVQTNAGNLFWEEEESEEGGGAQIGEPVPPGQPVYVTFDASGLGSDASSSNVLAVDGSTYKAGELPKTFRWTSGETHSFEWLSPVSGASGVQYIWVSTSGLSDKQSDTLTVDRYGFVVASYTLQYGLTISAQPSEGGSTDPAPGTYWYNPGSSVAISASPSSGWAFERWVGSGSGSYSGTSSSATITVNGPITETAYFYTFTISVEPSSGSCQQGGSASATVTVTFLGGYSASITVSLSALNLPSGASASFSPSSVTVSPSSPTATSTMTISTSPSTPTGTYSITVLGSGGGLTKQTTYTLTVTEPPTATVSFDAVIGLDASGVILTVDGVDYYPTSLPVSFTWTVGSTHSFTWAEYLPSSDPGARWAWDSTTGLSNSRSGTITVPAGGGFVNANYRLQVKLVLGVSPSGAGTTSPPPGEHWVDSGVTITVSATANAGYVFDYWELNGAYYSSDNPLSFTPASTAQTLIAVFKPWTGKPWLTGWGYRVPVTINSGTSLSNYQVCIVLDTASLISAGKMRSDCGDIRVTDSDGRTLIDFWIRPETINTASTEIWAEVPSIPSGTKTIYLYYGNPSASSASDGDATFIFFDDFSGGEIDYSKWTSVSDATIVSGAFRGTGGNRKTWAQTTQSFSASIAVRFRMRGAVYADFDSGIRVGNIYCISDRGTGNPAISTGWTYPGGSAGDVVSWHVYEARITSAQQEFRDLTAGKYATGTISYVSGPIYLIGDSDSSSRYTDYDWIFVRKYVSPEPTVEVGSEQQP